MIFHQFLSAFFRSRVLHSAVSTILGLEQVTSYKSYGMIFHFFRLVGSKTISTELEFQFVGVIVVVAVAVTAV